MDRPGDIARDPAVHAVGYRFADRPWGRWRPECSCGWRGAWCDRRTDAEHIAALHQTQPDPDGGNDDRGVW